MVKFFQQIIYLNLIVALSTAVLSAGFSRMIGSKQWLFYGLFAFFSTLAVYNGQRLFKATSLKGTPWLKWVREHRKALMVLSIISGICAVSLFIPLWNPDLISATFLGVSALISLLYVVKIKGRNMREIPYLKIHLIAFTWVLMLILFPMINEGSKENIIWISIAHYCYVLAVTIPFDIRDLKYDTPSHKTIPQVIGVTASKMLSTLLLIAFGAMMALENPILFTGGFFPLSILVQIILVLFMNEKRSDAYCAGAVDGAIALLGLSYFFVC
ncbi:MAG: hypothetical protein QNK23_02410 [Crocinitomicaceae bacterium]|nr:hypothetical protein [Crocinitomicaceae bacterium]